MDALTRDSLETARRTSPSEKLRQALDMMRTGYRLKLAGLRAQYPQESEAEIEQRFRRWLALED